MYLERSMLDFLHLGLLRIAKRIEAVQLGFSQPGTSGGSKVKPLTFVRNFEIVKLSPHVCPAGRFLNAPHFVNLIKARVTIRLQCAGKVAQVGARMFALTIR